MQIPFKNIELIIGSEVLVSMKERQLSRPDRLGT
jgi:hypothetical protein